MYAVVSDTKSSVAVLAVAFAMLVASKEKAALWTAELLVVGFSCEVEAQSRDFAVALDEELAHAPGDDGASCLASVCVLRPHKEVQGCRYDFCRTFF